MIQSWKVGNQIVKRTSYAPKRQHDVIFEAFLILGPSIYIPYVQHHIQESNITELGALIWFAHEAVTSKNKHNQKLEGGHNLEELHISAHTEIYFQSQERECGL